MPEYYVDMFAYIALWNVT